jgi:hypothetical protein
MPPGDEPGGIVLLVERFLVICSGPCGDFHNDTAHL